MGLPSGPSQRDTGAGFTLVELLLAVALIVLLLGAIVFNFTGLQQGASLDEGASQFESLLRFARAHAANTGRQVQLVYPDSFTAEPSTLSGGFRLQWEPDPVHRPGLFEPLLELQEYLRRVTDLVRIQEVRRIDNNAFPADPALAPPVPVAREESPDAAAPPESPGAGASPVSIVFSPDGSSDSAEFILGSRAEDDPRLVAVRLQGITGAIRRQFIADPSSEPVTPLPPDAAAESPVPANNPIPNPAP